MSALFSLLVVVACGGDSPEDPFVRPPGGGGCSAGEAMLPDGTCPPEVCSAGEHRRDDGRCAPAGLPHDMACPPGEHALTDGRCAPAGVPQDMACADGRFVPTGRGGCAPILPDRACPSGQMAVPGETACREVAPCGEGPWNAALPEEATTEYVDQRYPGSDSDGSRERPWKTVGEGVAAAAPGAIVAVSAGRYTEDVVVEGRAVRLWGLCPAQTEVVGLGVSEGAIVVRGTEASGSVVRGFSVSGPIRGIEVDGARSVAIEEVWVHDAGHSGVMALDDASVTVRGALVEDNHELGVLVSGSDATAFAMVVRATQVNGTGAFGWGISVQTDSATGERGKLVLTSSLVEDNRGFGVFVGGSDATASATVVRATQPDGTGARGSGIHVQADPSAGERGKLVLTSSLVEDNYQVGVLVLGSDAAAMETVVRTTRPDRTGAGGRGIDVEDDRATGERGKLELTSSLVEDNHDTGVFVGGSDATASATVVRATRPDGTGMPAPGIAVQDDPATGERGKLVLTSSLVEDNYGVGVLVNGSDAAVETTVVRATQLDGTDAFGRGILVQASATGEGGKLVLTSSLVEDNYNSGVFVSGSDATIEATAVRATQPNGRGTFGQGIAVQAGLDTGKRGNLVLTSSLVEANHDIGVFVSGSDATIEATEVRATQPDGTGAFGRGINVQADLATGERGKLALTFSLVEDNHDVGMFVAGSDATVAATVVRATRKAPAGFDYGDGILVLDAQGQSSVSLAATVSSGNARAGVMYLGSSGELSFVRSSGNRFGLVLQSRTGGAQPTLLEGNMFEGNSEQDRITDGDLPVPDAAAPLP